MTPTPLSSTDALSDFEQQAFTFDGITKAVYVIGSGPAVIVMTEMPGISPQVVRLAKWIKDAGMTVYLPSLFGPDGVTLPADEAVGVFKRTCLSAEFRGLASGQTSPIIHWLRQLARLAHLSCGGPGVGAVGLCFTGSFALSLMLVPAVLAPVVCHPSMPLDNPASPGLPADELNAVGQRLHREGLTALGLRFEGDRWCSAQRFMAYRQALGECFIEHVLPDSAAHPDPPPFFKQVVACPHSVVTAHLVDEAGHPTLAARDAIIQFLRSRLLTKADPGQLQET